MKLKFFILAFLSLIMASCAKKDPRIQAAYDLIERVTPDYSDQFELQLMEPVDGQDAYEIASSGDKILPLSNLKRVHQIRVTPCSKSERLRGEAFCMQQKR